MSVSPVKDTKNILIGYASIHLMDSASNVENLSSLASPSTYIGAVDEVDLAITKTFKPIFTEESGVKMLKENLLVSVEAVLSGKIIEMSKENISAVLGNGSVDILKFNQEIPKYRIEVKAMFPNNVNYLLLILPVVQFVNDNASLPMSLDEEASGIEFTARSCFIPNALWPSRYGSLSYV